ncbi:MAG: flagellar basal body P-ring protein FlgI [Bacteroidota bacterium]|nr:flagellar basal body P-ring protein FlgI [Candidatus Kapabacteria bacterium]MCS7302175.1 flagellar basal body P-ring protein FlgI [Candidatus Kapabacteria bacterium]MCX7936396.1 flagellar basal body P-ring protein FlgI [Chlorobiota bacterium]MDW8074324.1 flagellar basal body P-ring protein FlgI [Bacteroidota bacterium]MDW8271200.1 flagellar basal body P-ring protein FlgI [Bacteroidota bacterium]
MKMLKTLTQILCMTGVCSYLALGDRIKDIATVEGAGGLQVVGYGLVTGLNNTGDSPRSSFTIQSVLNMLKRFGITPQQNIFFQRTQNVAAVMVTATIPPFARAGTKIDVTVSSIGDARSLQGGTLVLTPLVASDGTVFGMAQGPLSVGGYDITALGSRAGKNLTNTARVPGGLLLERNVEGTSLSTGEIRILLNHPDYTTAVRIAAAINALEGLANTAQALDPATVIVRFPAGTTAAQAIEYIARIESTEVSVDVAGKVVINERTGTVVVGGNVRLLPAVVAHGGLEIEIQQINTAIQPAPFTIGTTARVSNAFIRTQEQSNPAVALPATTTVQDLANALNLLKVSPRDLVAIFQALKQAGALQAELVIQ